MTESSGHDVATSYEHLRTMLAAAGLWTWESDLVADTTTYQEGFWESYGHPSPGEIETFELLRYMHRGDQSGVTRAWRAHMLGETEQYEAEWRLRTAGGEWRWIRSRGRVTERGPDGEPRYAIGAYMDVTEFKRAEQALRGSEAELSAIFASASDAHILFDQSRCVVRFNEAAARMASDFLKFELVEGEPFLPGFDPKRYPILDDLQMGLAGKEFQVERSIEGENGTRWIELSFAPVSASARTVDGVAMTVREVTDRKRLEATRLQTMRLESMGLMAGGIAHDFNNLLAAIVGNIDVASFTATDPDARAGLSEARDAARRAAELVQQLLTFAGKHKPEVQPVDLSALTGEIVRYARKIPGASVRIEEELARGLPAVEADATQMRQLVMNLVVNAMQAAEGVGSRVCVRTGSTGDPRYLAPNTLIPERAAGRYVYLQVVDDGPGMDRDTVDRIFDPFFTTKSDGHGLGLASVLGTVRSHGGTVAVESEPGAGATFSVFLPAGA